MTPEEIAVHERDAEWKVALFDSCGSCRNAAAGEGYWSECKSGDCPLRGFFKEATSPWKSDPCCCMCGHFSTAHTRIDSKLWDACRACMCPYFQEETGGPAEDAAEPPKEASKELK